MAAVLGSSTLNRHRRRAASIEVQLAACVVIDTRMRRAAIVTDRVTHPARQMERQTAFSWLEPQRKQRKPRLPKTVRKLSARKEVCHTPMRRTMLRFLGSGFVTFSVVSRACDSATVDGCLDMGDCEDSRWSGLKLSRCSRGLRAILNGLW
jgi:hypothetical protein